MEEWSKKGAPVAAAIVEPIQSEGGDRHASHEFFRRLQSLLKEVLAFDSLSFFLFLLPSYFSSARHCIYCGRGADWPRTNRSLLGTRALESSGAARHGHIQQEDAHRRLLPAAQVQSSPRLPHLQHLDGRIQQTAAFGERFEGGPFFSSAEDSVVFLSYYFIRVQKVAIVCCDFCGSIEKVDVGREPLSLFFFFFRSCGRRSWWSERARWALCCWRACTRRSVRILSS